MKSVQGDSGHAQMKMVADVYSHIIDDDRRLNAQRFEEAFYSGSQLKTEQAAENQKKIGLEPPTEEEQQLILKILRNPELASFLKSLTETI